jgi:fucokinase
MTKDDRATFLRQAYRNNWQQYLTSLPADQGRPDSGRLDSGRLDSGRPDADRPSARAGWDVCVLTASDERQAASYRQQLSWRRQGGLLPVRTHFLVLADPGGRRIGSGGATLRVLHELRRAGSELHPDLDAAEPPAQPTGFRVGERSPGARNALASLRILIIHSGGDSRRLPHCSAVGKLFARVPRALPDGRASTIFDEFLISLSGLATELPPGVLVASGDVLLVYDHLQLSFQRPGVIGVAADVLAEVGTDHGVYVPDDRGRLRAYLHKPPLGELTRWDAIDGEGAVPIDTGLVWFDAVTVEKLANLAQDERVAALCGLSDVPCPPDVPYPPDAGSADPAVGLNLYGDLLLPLAESTTFAGYMADTSDGPATSQVRGARQVIWDRLRGTSFTVQRLRPAVFVHIGTSREYWHVTAADPELAQICGWTPQAVTWLAASARSAGECLVLVNTVLEGSIRLGGKPGLMTDCYLSGTVSCQGAAILAGVHTARSLALEQDVVLHQLPVDDGFVTRFYGLDDDPKRVWDDPGATFMSRPWADWLAEAGVAPEILWPDLPSAEWTLWNARLYPLVSDREESLRLALSLQLPGRAGDGWRAQWERAQRLSLATSFKRAGIDLILADSAVVEDRAIVQRACAAIEAEQPAVEIGALLRATAEARGRRSEHVRAWLSEVDPLLRLRGYKALAEATGDAAWEDRAFATLAEMIEVTLKEQRSAAREQQIETLRRQPRADRSVRVEASARVDFGGGWTDTPPHSIERGGEVLNAALTLRGAYPIAAEATWLPEPKLVLECKDIDATLEPSLLGEILFCANPADPFCLHKAALILRGLVPIDGDPDRRLSDVLRARGGGLRLSTGTGIPRGSGLGTSSILAGAVLACLGQMLEIEIPQSTLFDEVLCLEQMMTTGGGWQDQVGGLVGGIKLVTTEPGLPQVIQVDPVTLSPEVEVELAQRLVLVYTGQQRLAKNLLRIVVGRWLGRDPEMVWLLREIARLAQAMRAALQAGDIDGFGELLGEHWALNKRIDPGCTNSFIDALFAEMEPYICGGKLAGAGGGGFAIVVTRGADGEREMDRILRARYPSTPVAVWPCAIPAQAMVVRA